MGSRVHLSGMKGIAARPQGCPEGAEQAELSYSKDMGKEN